MESESGFTRSVTDALGSSDIQTDQMEGEKCVTRSIIHELYSWDIVKSKEKVVLLEVSLMNFILGNIQGDQLEDESGVTESIIDELHCWDIQGDQKKGEGGFTRSIIDDLHSSGMVKWKVKVVLLEVSMMDLILRISN